MSKIVVFQRSFKTTKAVADFYKIPYATLRHRIKNLGMKIEDAISLPVKKQNTGKVLVDGKIYDSFSAAARAYGKDPESTRQRLKTGMTAEEAILIPNKRSKQISYLDQNFHSISKFAKYFNLNKHTVHSRLRYGWSLDDIINKPATYEVEIKYRGNVYPSIAALCRKFNLPYKLVQKRIRTFGWSIKDSVEKPLNIGRSIKIKNKQFPTLATAARFYGVPPGLFQWRLSTGWPVEKAVDPHAQVSNRKPIVIDGEYFDDLSSAARAYGLNPTTFMKRIRSGWSHNQSAGLATPPKQKKGKAPVTAEEYITRLQEIHGDNLDFSKAVFHKAQDKVEVRCLEGKEHACFWATPNNLLRGKGCPICKISHGARKIAMFLDENKIHYEVEWTGHGLRSLEYDRAVLRMDFHLPDKQAIIEFDGIQHFEPQTLGRMTEKQARLQFKQTQKNDARKNKWAKDNNYLMIRIRYDETVTDKLKKYLI